MSFPLTWIEKGILAVGQMPTSENDIIQLQKEGIEAIINLQQMSYPKNWQTGSMIINNIPIEDGSVPDDDQVVEFLVTVQHHFERGEPIYVHCTAGCGRSGTMITLWYASLSKFDTVEEILGYLRSIRPCFVENKKQKEFVLERGLELIG